jgi:hypothetical protein
MRNLLYLPLLLSATISTSAKLNVRDDDYSAGYSPLSGMEDFGSGFGNGIWGAVKGLGNVIVHPIDTAKNIGDQVEDNLDHLNPFGDNFNPLHNLKAPIEGCIGPDGENLMQAVSSLSSHRTWFADS